MSRLCPRAMKQSYWVTILVVKLLYYYVIGKFIYVLAWYVIFYLKPYVEFMYVWMYENAILRLLYNSIKHFWKLNS